MQTACRGFLEEPSPDGISGGSKRAIPKTLVTSVLALQKGRLRPGEGKPLSSNHLVGFAELWS